MHEYLDKQLVKDYLGLVLPVVPDGHRRLLEGQYANILGRPLTEAGAALRPSSLNDTYLSGRGDTTLQSLGQARLPDLAKYMSALWRMRDELPGT
jgi:hypothetical protein